MSGNGIQDVERRNGSTAWKWRALIYLLKNGFAPKQNALSYLSCDLLYLFLWKVLFQQPLVIRECSNKWEKYGRTKKATYLPDLSFGHATFSLLFCYISLICLVCPWAHAWEKVFLHLVFLTSTVFIIYSSLRLTFYLLQCTTDDRVQPTLLESYAIG